MPSKNSGPGQPSLLIPAIIVGVAVIAGFLSLRSPLLTTADRLDEIRIALVDTQQALQKVAQARPAAATPTSGPDPNRRYTVKTAGAPAKGPDTAKVKIVEFSDFQWPFCARVGPTLTQIEKEYGDKVQILWKHMPLSMHPKAPAAHAASEAAHRQGKFWQMHDLIFANQAQMSPEKYIEFAQQIGLNVEKFKKDVAAADVKKRVDDDARDAASLGITGTPGFLVNGKFIKGAQPFEQFKQLIDAELGSS